MARLEKGDPAPAFALLDQDENQVALSDFSGKKVLLYFYPRANTPGCTRQACAVRDARQDFEERATVTLGISPDKPGAQKKFDDKYELGFPLLSDPDHAVAEAYGAWGEKKSGGKVREGIVRSSFLIDEAGRIEGAWYQVKPEATVVKALEAFAS